MILTLANAQSGLIPYANIFYLNQQCVTFEIAHIPLRL